MQMGMQMKRPFEANDADEALMSLQITSRRREGLRVGRAPG